jgi:hypothetical protein
VVGAVAGVAAAREVAEAEVALRGAAEPEVLVAVGRGGVGGQAPAVVTAEVEEEALPQSGPGASPETRGLPETPRPASVWHRRGHSPSAGCHPCLSSG